MAQALEDFLDQLVNVITCDGRNIIGILRGFDQTINLILSSSFERSISQNDTTQHVQLGLYVIRGENVACVGEVDEEKDRIIKWEEKKGETLKPVVH